MCRNDPPPIDCRRVVVLPNPALKGGELQAVALAADPRQVRYAAQRQAHSLAWFRSEADRVATWRTDFNALQMWTWLRHVAM